MLTAVGVRERRVSDVVFDAGSDRTTSHTSGRMTGRMEVVARVSGRRKWTSGQKLEILRDAFGPGGSVREAIELHEVSSGLLYTWRRQAAAGTLDGLTKPALLSFAEVCVGEPPMLPPPSSPAGGMIGIELPSGIRLSVDGSVDAEALARVLSVLPR